MTSISNDFRGVLSRHIEGAPSHKILLIANAIAQLEDPLPFASAAPAPTIARPRFEVIDSDLVTDHRTGLTWLRDYVPGGKRNWKDSVEAVSQFSLRGAAFRAPTIAEQLSIVDYERHTPAFDTDVFKGGSDWVWTSTADAESPGDLAWFVYFGYGYSNRCSQSGCGFVRGVRVGQF